MRASPVQQIPFAGPRVQKNGPNTPRWGRAGAGAYRWIRAALPLCHVPLWPLWIIAETLRRDGPIRQGAPMSYRSTEPPRGRPTLWTSYLRIVPSEQCRTTFPLKSGPTSSTSSDQNDSSRSLPLLELREGALRDDSGSFIRRTGDGSGDCRPGPAGAFSGPDLPLRQDPDRGPSPALKSSCRPPRRGSPDPLSMPSPDDVKAIGLLVDRPRGRTASGRIGREWQDAGTEDRQPTELQTIRKGLHSGNSAVGNPHPPTPEPGKSPCRAGQIKNESFAESTPPLRQITTRAVTRTTR